MAIDPPYRLDPFQNIVNVHWRESTAGTGLETLARLHFWVTSYVFWQYRFVGKYPDTKVYVSSATTYIEDEKDSITNPDHLTPPRRWGLFFNGALYRPLTNGPQTHDQENETEALPQPTTIIQSFDGTTFTQGAVIFDNGQSFVGAGSYDFSAVTADYIAPNADEIASDPLLADYHFPFYGSPRDIHFVCDTITDNINYPGPAFYPPGLPQVWFIEATI